MSFVNRFGRHAYWRIIVHLVMVQAVLLPLYGSWFDRDFAGRRPNHDHIYLGELVIGFSGEPAYQGEPNGLDLFVTHHETGESINGLEETLRAEIIYGSSTQELELRTQFGQEGAYTADILPTAAGDYTWRIWGDIEGTPVDVSMTSSPDTFSAVETKASVSFPAAEPTAAELLAASEAAAASARTATIVGIGGLVLGLVGTVIGFMGMRSGRRSITAAPARNQAASRPS